MFVGGVKNRAMTTAVSFLFFFNFFQIQFDKTVSKHKTPHLPSPTRSHQTTTKQPHEKSRTSAAGKVCCYVQTASSETCVRRTPEPDSKKQTKKSQFFFFPNAFIYQDFNDWTLEFVCGAAACPQNTSQSVVLNDSWLPSAGRQTQDIFLIFNWSTWGRGGGGAPCQSSA